MKNNKNNNKIKNKKKTLVSFKTSSYVHQYMFWNQNN